MTETTTKPWTLDDLFAGFGSPDLDASYRDVTERLDRLTASKDEILAGLTPDAFVSVCDDIDAIARTAHRIGAFAGLSFAADTSDEDAKTAVAKAEQLSADIDNAVLFFNTWWKDLSDDAAKPLMDASGVYENWLRTLRNARPYTLSEPEERVINVKNVTGHSSFTSLYQTVTGAYSYQLTVDGEEKTLTRGELMTYTRSADPQVRKDAYTALAVPFQKDAPVLGALYQNVVRSWANEHINLRGHDDAISVRNHINDLPADVVNGLFASINKNTPIFHRYFALKAKLLGQESLRRYDVYAPVNAEKQTYTYEEAHTLIRDSFSAFDPQFAKLAQEVADEDHIDSEIRPTKRDGAFCWTPEPACTPYVLVNFDGTWGSVSTLAHELGHAVHALAARDFSVFTQNPCLPLCETASTFGEMVLADHVLSQADSSEVQKSILLAELDGAYATVLRQQYFAMFEQTAHKAIMDGASLPELNALYLDNLRQQFGETVDVSDDFQHEWLMIPHIYATPFYVYAYSFGQLLTYSLYQQYLEEGDSFVPRFMGLLAAGGSKPPVELLADAGFDITKESFWDSGFTVIEKKLAALEELVAK